MSAEDGEAKMRGERERASELWAKEIAAPAARRLKPLPNSVLAPLMFNKTPECENDHPSAVCDPFQPLQQGDVAKKEMKYLQKAIICLYL